MTAFPLEKATELVAAILAHGRKQGLKPLTVAVLDAGSHLVALQREDGASTMRPAIAVGKASGALALGVSSRTIGEMAADRPGFIASLGPISPHGIIPAAGGLLVTGGSGAVIGAVGVTGDLSDADEACALAGIAAVGLSVTG